MRHQRQAPNAVSASLADAGGSGNRRLEVGIGAELFMGSPEALPVALAGSGIAYHFWHGIGLPWQTPGMANVQIGLPFVWVDTALCPTVQKLYDIACFLPSQAPP